MTSSFLEKQEALLARFAGLQSKEAIYQKIIDLGRGQAALNASNKTEDRLVPGCQSKMYLVTRYEDGKVYFETESDALISAGLGVLLTSVYSGESPEVVLKQPPTYIEQIGIRDSLTPGRANGLASLFLKMKRDTLRLYTNKIMLNQF